MPGPGSYLIGEEEKKAVIEVIESGYLFRYGDKSDPSFLAKTWQFEREIEKYLGTNHAVAINSGTSALWVAISALGIGAGDEVIVPGYTFVASMSSVIYAKAVPILAEIDETLTLDPEDVKKKITPRTKAIMLVHMLGNPGYIDEIKKIASESNLFLVEDSAQAFGATYRGKYVGTFGEFGTYSFNMHKTITAGEGGMVVTNDKELYKRAFGLHDQGHFPLRHGVERGNRAIIGLDFRMSELSAAVLLAQLKKIEFIKKTLREKKKRFKEGIKDIKGISFRKLPDPDGEIGTLLTVLFPNEEIARNIAKDLDSGGVLADSGWHVYNNMEHFLSKKMTPDNNCPFTCPYYKGEATYRKGMLPKTDSILARTINISIGVSDRGLGAGYGITIKSDNSEINKKVEYFRKVAERYL